MTTEQGVSLTGLAFDKELYGGGGETPYLPSIGVGDDEEQDEREQALSRSVSAASTPAHCCAATNALTLPHARCRRMQYTAPKSVLNSIPTDANDSVPPPLVRQVGLTLDAGGHRTRLVAHVMSPRNL